MEPVDPARAADAFSDACPSRAVLQHLTGRWGALTLAALGEGPMRFGDLRRRVSGISDRMLARTLSDLERDGIVIRTVRSAIPPHVEYEASPLGADLASHLGTLIHLLESRFQEVRAAQRDFDARQGDPSVADGNPALTP